MFRPESPRPEERLVISRRIINIFGPEWSGKTTQTRLLSSHFNMPYVVTGDLLRDIQQNDHTELGDRVRAMFASNNYLDATLMLSVIENHINEHGELRKGFILDGGLRKLEEVRGFQSMLEKADCVMPVTVVHLRLPAWLSLQRVRLTPERERRPKDTQKKVLERLGEYNKNLGLRASHIRYNEVFGWKMFHIDARGSEDEVFQQVVSALRG